LLVIDATLLFHGTTVFSPWFPRRADMLRVVAECIALSDCAITIRLYTKDAETAGDGDPVDAAVALTMNSVGRSSVAEWTTSIGEPGVLQLLRFQYEVTGDNGDPNEWILFRLLPAVWFDAIKA
jgi:hypothetical protein